MLPYHRARFAALQSRLGELGATCVAIQVARSDSSYGDIDSNPWQSHSASVITLFDNGDYLGLKAREVAARVCESLVNMKADVVFAPAPAFAEGAGALHYKVGYGGKLILMDNAWSATDHKGGVTRIVKRLLYGFFDGGFFPAKLHGDYFSSLNIPINRQRYGLNTVGALDQSGVTVSTLPRVPVTPFILFVGRIVPVKNLQVVIDALALCGKLDISLVVIGDGPELKVLQRRAVILGVADKVHWLGRQSNQIARGVMTKAEALVLPSVQETWGLVVNEAWLAGVPVIGSDTVGALRASLPHEMEWMMPPSADSQAWLATIEKLLSLTVEERQALISTGYALANTYSLETHVNSAIELINLRSRHRPWVLVGCLARLWQGRVAIW